MAKQVKCSDIRKTSSIKGLRTAKTLFEEISGSCDPLPFN